MRSANVYVRDLNVREHTPTCTVGHCIKMLNAKDIINPRRACTARVTVVILCVSLSVCHPLLSHYRLRGGL